MDEAPSARLARGFRALLSRQVSLWEQGARPRPRGPQARSGAPPAHPRPRPAPPQVLTKALSFALNLSLARLVGPEGVAVLALQYPLFLATVLSLSREPFRRGCARLASPALDAEHPGTTAASRVLAVAWAVVPCGAALGAVVTAGTLAAAGSLTWDSGLSLGPWETGLLLHLLAATVELLAEPLVVLSLAEGAFRPLVAAEALGTALRGATTLAAVAPRGGGLGVHAAAGMGQLAYAAAAVAVHAAWRARDVRDWARGWRAGTWRPAAPPGSARGVAVFAAQAAGKHVLSEGEKLGLVLGGAAARAAQGTYGLAAALGSLVTRNLLRPLEESAFLAFSAFSASPGAGGEGVAGGGLESLAGAVAAALKAALAPGLLAAAAGPPLAASAVRALYGAAWAETEVAALLRGHCWLLLPLAANGTCEAFHHATAGVPDLWGANLAMAAVSAVHVAGCWALVPRVGLRGLLVAGCVSTGLRLAWSGRYLRRALRGRFAAAVRGALPSRAAAAALALCAAVARASERAVYVPGMEGGGAGGWGLPVAWNGAANAARRGAEGLACAAADEAPTGREVLAAGCRALGKEWGLGPTSTALHWLVVGAAGAATAWVVLGEAARALAGRGAGGRGAGAEAPREPRAGEAG